MENIKTAADAGLTTIIASSKGLALYVYKPDTPAMGTTAAKSACTAGCLAAWPLFYATPPVTVPAGLDVADFGSFDRGAGVMQSTYKGWPLYFYKDDTMAGTVKGDGEAAVWFAVRVPFVAPK
jgi:predicted lipoprotein with Yx(FWY)xxD motif